MIEYQNALIDKKVNQQDTHSFRQFVDKLEEKQLKIIARFKELFQKYGIKDEKNLKEGLR